MVSDVAVLGRLRYKGAAVERVREGFYCRKGRRGAQLYSRSVNMKHRQRLSSTRTKVSYMIRHHTVGMLSRCIICTVTAV
jgi:hypothetical protein